MIASLVKEGRVAKGFTQKELSELSHVSVRSIQRIENAELVPRSYTLKTLATILDIPFESFQPEASSPVATAPANRKLHTGQKVVLSIGITLAVVLLAAAFLAQSTRFPETSFEAFNFALLLVLLISAALFLVWKK